jgi:hypothetical protein
MPYQPLTGLTRLTLRLAVSTDTAAEEEEELLARA